MSIILRITLKEFYFTPEEIRFLLKHHSPLWQLYLLILIQDITFGVSDQNVHLFSYQPHTQQANCKRFLATVFGFKIAPSSGHYIRTEKQHRV
jgi:hypothetical protein